MGGQGGLPPSQIFGTTNTSAFSTNTVKRRFNAYEMIPRSSQPSDLIEMGLGVEDASAFNYVPGADLTKVICA